MSLVECIYNPNHKMKKSQKEIHEMRCPDRFKKQNEFLLCPYNPTHKIKKELYERHLLECANKPKISKEEKENVEKARELNDIITEQDEIQYTRMKYYKNAVQEPEIIGVSKSQMKKNKKKREKMIKNKFKKVNESESKSMIKMADDLDQENYGNDNPNHVNNFEEDYEFDYGNENDNAKEEFYTEYNPNDEDKDIGKYSANIINPEDIDKILGYK